MLHLYPIRVFVAVILALSAVALLAAVYAGFLGHLGFVHDARLIVGLSSSTALSLWIASHAAWRWLPPLRRVIFPYLGGRWAGELSFEGANGRETRRVTLDIDHTPYRLTMALESSESTSHTLVVHAERASATDSGKMYYVFVNRRKEGLPGGGETYRGLAILRLDPESGTLHGDYFTERKSAGTLFLSLVDRHPWWMLWK